MKTIYELVAHAIKSRVDAFSERELALRCGVAATANAIAVEFDGNDILFDIAQFAQACGLYMSDGRDTYSDCYPGELTWERPRTAADAPPPIVTESDPHADVKLVPDLPAYNGWTAYYEYPGFIRYTHPAGDRDVCASSDFNGDGKLDIQIQTDDGHSIDDGENAPWPHEERTAEKLFARLRPYLDKYQPISEES